MSTRERPSAALDPDALQDAEDQAAEAEARAKSARARAERARQQAAAATAADDEPAETADDPAAEGDDTPVDTASRKQRRPRWLHLPKPRTVGAATLVGIAAAALAASGFIGWQHRIAAQQKQRTAEYSAAAREGAEALMSLDHANAQATVQRVLDHATGKFKARYQETAESLTKDLEQSKVVTKVTASDVAVESMTDKSAVVLVAARTEGTNAEGAPQQPRLWRIGMTLTRDGGQLKISDVEFVQ